MALEQAVAIFRIRPFPWENDILKVLPSALLPLDWEGYHYLNSLSELIIYDNLITSRNRFTKNSSNIKVKVKLSLQQDMEAYRVLRR
jgi:hypothetical protein